MQNVTDHISNLGLEYPSVIFILAAISFALSLCDEKSFSECFRFDNVSKLYTPKSMRNILQFVIIALSFFYIIDSKGNLKSLSTKVEGNTKIIDKNILHIKN